jgi:hypothetical protein
MVEVAVAVVIVYHPRAAQVDQVVAVRVDIIPTVLMAQQIQAVAAVVVVIRLVQPAARADLASSSSNM